MTPFPLIASLLAAAAASPATPAAKPASQPVAQPGSQPASQPTPGLEGVPVKVERRLLVKTRRYFTTGGLCFFDRGDYYNNPGLAASGSYYVSEQLGAELRLAGFFSFLNAAGAEIFERTGLVPDAHKPILLIEAGARYTVGYGKLQLWSNPGSLVHFDFQVAGRLGGVITDRALTPSLSLSPSVLMRFSPQVVAQLDLGFVLSLEQRSRTWFALGFLPTVTVGVPL